MRQPLQIICCLIGILLLINSLFLLFRTNFNIGTLLPALVGLPLVFAALFYHRLASGSGFWFWARIGLIAGYSVLITVLLLIAGLMLHQLRQEPDPEAEALVVLGAAVFGDQVSLTLASRLDTALTYWQTYPDLLIVVCGGQGPDEDVSEAYAMAKYLEHRGVPSDQLLLEDQSVNTRENLRYARKHLLEALAEDQLSEDRSTADDNRQPNIIVVTSGYHVLRAVDTAQKEGFIASSLGAPVLWYLLPGDFLRESLALVYFFLFGH